MACVPPIILENAAEFKVKLDFPVGVEFVAFCAASSSG